MFDKHLSSSEGEALMEERSVVSPPKIFDFEFEGRLGRLNYINGFWIIVLSVAILMTLLSLGYYAIIQVSPRVATVSAQLCVVLIGLSNYIFYFRLICLRGHDMGIPSKKTIFYFWGVPLALLLFFFAVYLILGSPHLGFTRYMLVDYIFMGFYIIFGLYCGLLFLWVLWMMVYPGDLGENAFGKPVKQGPWVGAILTVIAVIVIALIAIYYDDLIAMFEQEIINLATFLYNFILG